MATTAPRTVPRMRSGTLTAFVWSTEDTTADKVAMCPEIGLLSEHPELAGLLLAGGRNLET